MKKLIIFIIVLVVFGSCKDKHKTEVFLIMKNQKITDFYNNKTNELLIRINNSIDTLFYSKKNAPIIYDIFRIDNDCKIIYMSALNLNINNDVDSLIQKFLLNPKNYAKDYPVHNKPDMLKENNNDLKDKIITLYNNSKENKVSEKLFKSEIKKIVVRYRYKVLAEFVGHIGSNDFHFYDNFIVANCDYKKYKKNDTIKLNVFQVYEKYNFDFKINDEIIEKDNYKASFYTKTPEIKGELVKTTSDSLVVRYPFYKKL